MGGLFEGNIKFVMEKVLITILDSVGPTSMPYNEFVLWRAHHCEGEKQILIVVGGNGDEQNNLLDSNLDIIRVGWNPFHIRTKLLSLLTSFKKTNIPYSIHLHQLKSATITQLSMLGTGFRKKTVFTVHSTFTGYALHNKIQSFLNGIMARYVTCVSDASYNLYPKAIKRIKGDKVLTIRNGVDGDRINAKLAGIVAHKDDSLVQFIYVARLIPLKNHMFLMDVIKKASPRARFVFVGKDGKNDIMNKIKKEGMGDRVILTGQIPREEVFTMLNNSDAYISSSTLEGMPISVLEAMYCKLPAILSNIPQHKEIGGNDSFVSYLPFEVDKWVEKINEVVNLSHEERELKGQDSRMYVEKNFSLYAMHQKYNKLYDILRQC